MKPDVFETILRVRYQETDQMGVVHHSNYAVWFEAGRTALIRELGLSYAELEKQGILLPVVDLHCRFLEPARYDEEIRILTRLKEMMKAKLVFAYEARRKTDGVLLAKGTTTHLWVDREMKRLDLRRKYPDIYDRLSACVTGQGG